MKTIPAYLLSACLLLFWNQGLQASHVMGGDIAYQHISGKKYKIIYRVYRSCNDLPLTAVGFNVSCDNGSNTVALSPLRTSIRDISQVCSRDTLPCSPANTTTGAGMEEHTFEQVLDFAQSPYEQLSKNCCRILFSMNICCRNASVTNVSPDHFYLESMLDLCMAGTKGNQSAVFKYPPLLNICCNQPMVYNTAASETGDGDSLSYSLEAPLKGLNDPVPYTGSFTPSIPMTPYCPPNPGVINCRALPGAKPPRGLYFDPGNADFVLTPVNCSEGAVLVFKTTEWRKDSLGQWRMTGFVKRESTWLLQNCPDNNPPYFTGNNKYSVCEGNRLCFTIGTKDEPFLPSQNQLDTVFLEWDTAIRAAEFRITDTTAREKTAEFCWQTKAGDARPHVYSFSVKAGDNHCPNPLLAYRSFQIRVKPKAGDRRLYTPLPKGGMEIYALPADTILHTDYRFTNTIRDSSNSGTPLYTSFNKQRDTFVFPAAGLYYLEHMINNPPYNCPALYTDTLLITSAHMSRLNLHQIYDLQVYPNPGKGKLNLKTSDFDLQKTMLKVYGADGRCLLSMLLKGSGPDLSVLAPGAYLLEFREGEKLAWRRLLIE